MLLTHCTSSNFEQDSFIWMEAPVYLCCNAWDYVGEAEDGTATKVRSLFLTEELLVFEDELDDSGQQVFCTQCCYCPSEFTMRVRIFAAGQQQAREWGFSLID